MARALAAACGPGQRGISEEAREAEQVMGIEPMLVVWDKRKEWTHSGSCRCVLEGQLGADSCLSCQGRKAAVRQSGRTLRLARRRPATTYSTVTLFAKFLG
jgi:hypothetical protein